MILSDKCRRLADAIRSIFEDGFIIDDRIKRYIDACLPGTTMAALTRGICEAPDHEIAPIMDLIFFPDETHQARLEPLLEAEKYGRDDETAVVTLLTAETIQTPLRDSDGIGETRIRIPSSAVAPFVHRLGIRRRIPQALANTITGLHPQETACRLKVRIRNARISFTPPATEFLTLFFLGIAPGDKEQDTCLEFALSLLGEQESKEDPFKLLRSRIDSLYKANESARTFEKQLRAHNMETLMHMGVRPPEIGSTEAARKIKLLEKIGDAVALGGVISRRQG